MCSLLLCLLSTDALYVTTALYSPTANQTYEGAWCDTHWCRGAVGELKLGLRAEVYLGLELDVGVRHVSYIEEGDRGSESAYVSVTWRPFGNR